jgi:hypothetical protein
MMIELLLTKELGALGIISIIIPSVSKWLKCAEVQDVASGRSESTKEPRVMLALGFDALVVASRRRRGILLMRETPPRKWNSCDGCLQVFGPLCMGGTCFLL